MELEVTYGKSGGRNTLHKQVQRNTHYIAKKEFSHLKSPSLYFPKACRITVIMAIRGFTTQNCRVA